MAIRVKHAPSAAAIGESAYTVGRGQRRERDIRLAHDISLRQQALDLQERGQELGAERSAEQLALQREGLEFRKEEALAGRELAERRWNEEPSRQLQKGLQQQKLLEKNVAWQYDESQKRAMAHIVTGIAWLREQVASGKWTAEQAEQAEQQLWQKYYSIIPLPAYDDQPKPQELWDRGLVTDSTTGAQYRQKGNGDFEPIGISFKEYSTLYANTLKAMFSQDIEGKDVTDYAAVDETVLKAITRFSQIQGLAAKAEQQQGRPPPPPPPPSIEEEAKMRAAVVALPKTFTKAIKDQPEIGRKKKGKTSGDMVYGEQAYNNTLVKAIEDKPDIPPEVIKTELDKWWLAKYEEEKEELFQKFGNPLEFEGAGPEAGPEAAPGKIKFSREADYGPRADGTPKGTGFLGELALQGGGVATEYSIGVEFDGKETEIPTLVPTLTKDELNLMVKDIIPNKKEIPKAIVKKAIDHAKQRMKQGKSPFAEPGEAVSAKGRVKMKSPSGKVYEVDRSEAKEAEKHGWVIF